MSLCTQNRFHKPQASEIKMDCWVIASHWLKTNLLPGPFLYIIPSALLLQFQPQKQGRLTRKNQRIYNHIYMQLFPEIEHETSQYIHRCDTNKCAIPRDLTWDCCINCNFYNHQQLHLKNIPSSNQTWPRMAMNPIICSHWHLLFVGVSNCHVWLPECVKLLYK